MIAVAYTLNWEASFDHSKSCSERGRALMRRCTRRLLSRAVPCRAPPTNQARGVGTDRGEEEEPEARFRSNVLVETSCEPVQLGPRREQTNSSGTPEHATASQDVVEILLSIISDTSWPAEFYFL